MQISCGVFWSLAPCLYLNLLFSLPYLWPDWKLDAIFYTWSSRQYLDSCLSKFILNKGLLLMILSIKIKSSIKKGLIEDQNANTINYSRPKTAKIDTLVLTKEAIKPYSLGPTISTYLISGSSPPPPRRRLYITNRTCILVMTTPTTYSPCSLMRAVTKRSLPSVASNIIQPDRIRSLTVRCLVGCWGSAEEPELTTNHIRVIDVPQIIAHRAPLSVMINFDATIVVSTIRQANIRSAFHADVSAVSTVMVSPPTMSAVVEVRLASWTSHVIYPYRTRSLPMGGTSIRL